MIGWPTKSPDLLPAIIGCHSQKLGFRVIWSDEKRFVLKQSPNKQLDRYWDPKNPNEIIVNDFADNILDEAGVRKVAAPKEEQSCVGIKKQASSIY